MSTTTQNQTQTTPHSEPPTAPTGKSGLPRSLVDFPPPTSGESVPPVSAPTPKPTE